MTSHSETLTSHFETQLSPPRWGGFRKQHQVGGAALIAFGLVLWALFLGTVGAPIESPRESTTALTVR